MKWEPVDIVVIGLSSSVLIVIFGTAVKAIVYKESFSEERSQIVAGIVASILAIVSLYVGSRLRKKDDGGGDGD